MRQVSKRMANNSVQTMQDVDYPYFNKTQASLQISYGPQH